jgi:nicotinamide/nicotinate riboside kinase
MTHGKLTIGVGGASCSGKSTLCSYLHYLLPNSVIIRQDSFYKLDSLIPTSNGTANWDSPEAIDMIRFVNALLASDDAIVCKSDLTSPIEIDQDLVKRLRDAVNGRKVIIVDGFLIYEDKNVYEQFDVSIFLEASKEELKKRRSQRQGYITLEGYWADPVGYFEEFVWPQYMLYNQNVFQGQIKNLVRLSSQQGISTMVSDSINELYKLL